MTTFPMTGQTTADGRPMLLDLFCCSEKVISGYGSNNVRPVRHDCGNASRHPQVLLTGVRTQVSYGLSQDQGLSTLRYLVSGSDKVGRQQAALFEDVREEPQLEASGRLAAGASGGDAELRGGLAEEEPRVLSGPESVSSAGRAGLAGWRLRRLRGNEECLASRGLCARIARSSISAPKAPVLHHGAPGGFSNPLREPPLRTDTHWPYRGDVNYAVNEVPA